jgi:hypothetical protein
MNKVGYYLERFMKAKSIEKTHLIWRFFMTIYAYRIGNLFDFRGTNTNVSTSLDGLKAFSQSETGIKSGCVLIQNHYFSLKELVETNWISLPKCSCAFFVEEIDFFCDPDTRTIIELNRLTWLLPLIVRSTNDDRETVVRVLESYLDSDMVSRAYRWGTSIDVAVQLMMLDIIINALEDSSGKMLKTIRREIWRRFYFLTKVQSKYSSSNNHLIYELLGKCIYLGSNGKSIKQRNSVLGELSSALELQYYESGLNKELSVGYHFGLVDLYSFVYLVCNDEELSDIVLNQLNRSIIASDYLCKFTQEFSQIGDSDNSYILSNLFLPDVRNECILKIARSISGNHDNFAPDEFLSSGPYSIEKSSLDPWLVSVLVRRNDLLPSEQYSITTDVGPFGLGPLGAHGHSDSLSVLLSVNKEEFFVDRGTHNYTSNPYLRNFLRSSRAHNTVSINNTDLRISKSPFISYHHNPKCDFNFQFIGKGIDAVAELKAKSIVKTKNSSMYHERVIGIGVTQFSIQDTVASNENAFFHFEYNYTLHPHIRILNVLPDSKTIELVSPTSQRVILKVVGQATVMINRVPISPSFGKLMWTNSIRIEGKASGVSSIELLGMFMFGRDDG